MGAVQSSAVKLGDRFDAAVVIPTVLRSELKRAVRSVFNQRFDGRVQVLIGIDKPLGERRVLEELERERPHNCALTVFDLGYSTSTRNGGIYSAGDGGALRTIMSLAANSQYVAYLDDDNWWREDHLATLHGALQGHAWAYSLRILVDEPTLKPICIDRWHSVGPHRGAFKDTVGGFCDPSTLMVDKLRCHYGLAHWCRSGDDKRPSSADRRIFRYLVDNYEGQGTHQATAFYVMRRTNRLWRDIRRMND